MSDENCVNPGQGFSQKKNFLCNREEKVRKMPTKAFHHYSEGSSVRDSIGSSFSRPTENFLSKNIPELKKEPSDHLWCLEQKIENLKGSLDEAEMGIKTPSTGRTVKLGRASKEEKPKESSFQSLMAVRDSVQSQMQNMLREQELLQEQLKSSDNDSPSPRSDGSGSQKSICETFRIEDVQYQHLRQCRNIVDNLLKREIQSIKNRQLMNSGAGDGKAFSGDFLPIQTDTLGSTDIREQRKNLVEKIYLMSQQLKDLEKHEKL